MSFSITDDVVGLVFVDPQAGVENKVSTTTRAAFFQEKVQLLGEVIEFRNSISKDVEN